MRRKPHPAQAFTNAPRGTQLRVPPSYAVQLPVAISPPSVPGSLQGRRRGKKSWAGVVRSRLERVCRVERKLSPAVTCAASAHCLGRLSPAKRAPFARHQESAFMTLSTKCPHCATELE